MGILSLVLMGGVAYSYLQVDRLPPVSIGVVSVSVVWPNASAENVERLVAEPLENAISGISGVDTITSNSSQGSCTVLVQLVDGYDPNQADIDIQQAMGPVIRQLPAGASAPVVRKFDPNASPILNLAFTGAPLDQLYDIASNQIQATLACVPGVGQVNISGGLQREIQVQLDYTRLAAYGITVQQVSQALVSANVSVPSGSIPVGTENISVVPQGLFQRVQDFQNVVITNTPTGGSVRVGDIATVKEGDKTQYTLQRPNGQDAVGLSITANSDANTVAASDARRYDTTTLAQIPVGSIAGTGAIVTLGQIATITNGSGPVSIQRVNRADTVTLSASAVGRPLGDVAAGMRQALNTLSMPAGYSYALRGSVQVFNQAITALAAALVLSIMLEDMLLVALYESWLLPFVLVVSVLFAAMSCFELPEDRGRQPLSRFGLSVAAFLGQSVGRRSADRDLGQQRRAGRASRPPDRRAA